MPDPNGGPKLVDHGVHAFVVPMRDGSGITLPGVEIHDCGYKVMQHASGSVHCVIHSSSVVGSVFAAAAAASHMLLKF